MPLLIAKVNRFTAHSQPLKVLSVAGITCATLLGGKLKLKIKYPS